MRWTDEGPPLAICLRRAHVLAFWVMATAVLALALLAAARAAGTSAPWAWAAGTLCILLPGLFWPPWFETGVKAWNKGARLLAAALRAYVLMVCYYLLFVPVGRAGSSLDPGGSSRRSGWLPRSQDDHAAARPSTARERWYQALHASSRNGNRWVMCLVPVVFLLRVFGDEPQENAPPSSTYTLY